MPNSPKESNAAYILLLMSGLWITEVIPLCMTTLLPLVLAPLMGLVPSAVIAKEYSSADVERDAANLVSLNVNEQYCHKRDDDYRRGSAFSEAG
ncbi:unnamed protein product [Dibothriocephalus latus]|uniref:Uncharacterized protein n=1 Tax=Dibothriocephalus latus TaxID=60516 RepID=A0A3P6PSF2_DIBLA|nr:unnamed protein product [Dibothriocephalus latus]